LKGKHHPKARQRAILSKPGGDPISKSGFNIKGIKAAAAVRITGAVGMAIATSNWALEAMVGIMAAVVMFIADSFPDAVRQEKQEFQPHTDKD